MCGPHLGPGGLYIDALDCVDTLSPPTRTTIIQDLSDFTRELWAAAGELPSGMRVTIGCFSFILGFF